MVDDGKHVGYIVSAIVGAVWALVWMWGRELDPGVRVIVGLSIAIPVEDGCIRDEPMVSARACIACSGDEV
jgi:hypothetical protein